MRSLRIGLLNKKRGNFTLQEKFAGKENVVDETSKEVAQYRKALTVAGYDVVTINWGPNFINSLKKAKVDLVFNVSSLIEAEVLEKERIPYVGSDSSTIALATDKSLAKRIWQINGLPTSPYHVARNEENCKPFKKNPPFDYPLFIKPLSGRGSCGITPESVVKNYNQLVRTVERIYTTMKQPALIERFLDGREIIVGIIGNDGDARVLSPLEIRKNGQILTYEKKQLDDDEFICPAELTKAETARMQSLAIKAYKQLGFKDYGRIDTILTKEGPFLLEGNTFAGLLCTPKEKPHSYIGFMAVAEGKGEKELLDEIVETAVTRYEH